MSHENKNISISRFSHSNQVDTINQKAPEHRAEGKKSYEKMERYREWEREKSQQQNDLLYFVFKFADLSFYEGNLTIQVKICLFPQLYFMLLDWSSEKWLQVAKRNHDDNEDNNNKWF